MSAIPNPADDFEPYRRRLRGLAYRMLGSMADAEDAVQEAYLRWHRADRGAVSDARAFLMTTTTRICLDILTSARARHEAYVGPWLPEPVLDTAALAPDRHTELAEDLSIALLLTLDRLSPLERAAFLLHDVFDFSFSEVAAALERSEAACRQLAARARGHVRDSRPRGAAGSPGRAGDRQDKHTALLSAFVAAVQTGELDTLTRLLAHDVRVLTDGGGKVRAAPNVVEGAERAAQFLVEVTRKRPDAWWRDDFRVRFGAVNGLPGIIIDSSDGPVQTTAFEIEEGVIRALYVVRNPDKLRHLRGVTVTDAGASSGINLRVHGVRYQCRDVSRAVAFYTSELGFELKVQQGEVFAAVSLGGLDVLLSGAGSSGARPLPDGQPQEPGGSNRLVLAVDDLEAAVARLKSRGVRFRSDILSGPGGTQVQILDPDGNPIELFQPAARLL